MRPTAPTRLVPLWLGWPRSQIKAPSPWQAPWHRRAGPELPGARFVASGGRECRSVFATAAAIKLRFPARCRCVLLGPSPRVLVPAWGRVSWPPHSPPRPRVPSPAPGCAVAVGQHKQGWIRAPIPAGAAAAQGGGAPRQGCTDSPADTPEPRGTWALDPAASSPCSSLRTDAPVLPGGAGGQCPAGFGRRSRQV